MAFPRLVDLLVAPLRALARAQGALSRSVLEWLRGRFHADEGGALTPKMLGVPSPDPRGEHEIVAVPVAALVPPPGLELAEAKVSLELEIVRSERRSSAPRASIAFEARPTAAAPRRRAGRHAAIRMEVTVRAVEPGPALRRLEERLTDPGAWRPRRFDAAPRRG